MNMPKAAAQSATNRADGKISGLMPQASIFSCNATCDAIEWGPANTILRSGSVPSCRWMRSDTQPSSQRPSGSALLQIGNAAITNPVTIGVSCVSLLRNSRARSAPAEPYVLLNHMGEGAGLLSGGAPPIPTGML